jgi:hypothetical protein
MVMHRVNPTATHFLNVDLDISSGRDLQALVAALGKKVIVLYIGRIRRTHHAHLALANMSKTADATIRRFCALIEALPKVERDLWNTAKARDFNVGVQAGTQPYSSEFPLAAETLKAAYDLGARIAFTVYAPGEPRKPVAKDTTGSKNAPGAERRG